MLIKVLVKPNAFENRILSCENGLYKISIKAPAKEGKANLELLKFLKKEFGKKVKLVSGANSRIKRIEMF